MYPSITDMEVDRQQVYAPCIMPSFIVKIKSSGHRIISALLLHEGI